VPLASWRRRAAPLVRLLAGVGVSAVATYVYLIVVARALGPELYASFSGFWAVVVILGAGVYLPIEQETGRRGVDLHGGGARRGLGRSAVQAALAVTVVLAVVLVAAWPAWATFFADDRWLGVALVLAGLGYAVQYPVRGLLSAQRQYGRYAAVLGTEGLLRVVLVVALVAALGSGASAGGLAAVVGLAALGSAIVGAVGLRAAGLRAAGGALALLRSVSVLITGAVALQTLLYGGVLVARVLAPAGQEAAAGQLLAAITVTRIPVFVFQSLEALVVPRIAELAVRGDVRELVVSLRRLVALVAGLAVLAAVGSAVAGPALVSLMFGSEYAVTHGTMALLGGGTAVFMLAVAASDITVSLGGHARMAGAWVAGLGAGVLSLFFLSDFTLQVTLPLLVGSAVAAVLLARSARARIRELTPART
jgi:O-antigen/teichoic acid export membrane protein